MSVTLNNHPLPVECDGCGRPARADTVNTHLCDGGLTIDPRTIGYYGGYIDLFPYDELDGSAITPWKLCALCAEKFFETFPNLKRWINNYYITLGNTTNPS